MEKRFEEVMTDQYLSEMLAILDNENHSNLDSLLAVARIALGAVIAAEITNRQAKRKRATK